MSDGADLDLAAHAERLLERYGGLDGLDVVAAMIEREFPGEIALVSSFGTGSAVLLDMVARVDPRTPVLFLDTGKLFGETRRYRDRLVERLGLRDVRTLHPDPAALAEADPKGLLWTQDPDRCCQVRKVEPLERGLAGFRAWFTGRRRGQSPTRAGLAPIEAAEGRIKVNPLAAWSDADVDAYFAARDLPRHPLEADGFLSIGCMPCTDRVAPGEDPRAGRWRGRDKIECGIHLPRSAQTRVGAIG